MARGPYGDLDAPFLPVRAPLTLAHDTNRLMDQLGSDAVHEDEAVGDPSGELQHLRSSGCNVDRHGRSDMLELSRLAFRKTNRLAGEQRSAERNSFRKNRHLGWRKVHRLQRAVADADAERGATTAKLRKRGEGCRCHGGVARNGICDGSSQPDSGR
jgi:hypothetical protein